MSEIRRAVVKSYDAAAHKADVQIAGSLAVWLDDVRVATNIPAADVVAGRQCAVLFLDPSNQDDAVVITVQGALPSVPSGATVAASATVVSETAFGQPSAAGSASPYSRGDHTHGTPADPVPAHAAIVDAHAMLAAANTWAALQTFSAALRVHNDGIEDRFGTRRIQFSTGFPFAERVRIQGAVSGITLAVQDGDLDIEDGDLIIQELNITRETFTGGYGIRVQPSAVNQNVALQAVPSGTGVVATFDMYNDSAATDADRVRFGAGPGGLGIECATGMVIDFNIGAGTVEFHLTEDAGYFSVPILIGTNAAPATSALLELRSTTGALLLPRMTTTQRNALTAVNGMIIYNTTTNVVEAYENGAWVNV